MMKKLLFTMLMVALCGTAYGQAVEITCDPYVSPSDVTIAHLEDCRSTMLNVLNAFPGENINTGSVSNDALSPGANMVTFRKETFNDWVYTGLIPPTAASLATTTTLGTAYIQGDRVVKDATAHTYTASKYTYVDLASNGTYTYTETAIGAGEPAVTAGSIRLSRVSTDGTTVAHIRDDRVMSVSLDSNQENFQRVGLTISVVTPDDITITPGVVYHGTTRINKIADTALSLGTAGDFVTNGGARANTTMGFVVINQQGVLKLTPTAPTIHDTAGNTAGLLRYSVVDSNNYRVLAWFYMNGNGAGELDTWGFGNFKDGAVSSAVNKYVNVNPTIAAQTYAQMADTALTFYSAGGDIKITGAVNGYNSTGGATIQIAPAMDGGIHEEVGMANQCNDVSADKDGNFVYTTVITQDTTQGNHTMSIYWRTGSGTGTAINTEIIVEEL